MSSHTVGRSSTLASTNKEEELLKLLIKKELKEEKIFFFNTWFNENCVLVIDKKKKRLTGNSAYRVWVAIYEPTFGKNESIFKLIKVVKKITKVKEEWGETIEYFKKALNSEHPAAKLYNNFYTLDLPALSRDYKNVIKFTKNLSLNNNPDDYLKPYDIVKVNRKGGTYQHAAIYLGNGKVAHIYYPEESNNREDLRARIDSWETFLNGAKEIEIHHPFIPFKKPELIQKHIEIAIKAEYGKGKYKSLSNNCEHFATLCVYGLGICRQKNINTISKATKSSDYLLQAIQETNQFFEQLEKDQLQQEAWVEIPSK